MKFHALLWTTAFWASLGAHAAPAGEDPLTVQVQSADALRFAALFKSSQGQPSAAQLQSQYLNGAGRGVVVMTPNRIEDASKLAAAVASQSANYRYAIDTCLPLLDGLTPELRAIYLAYQGLLPKRPLPQVHVVFGAGNSGGTAAPDAQVVGLEVMCAVGTTPEQFRQRMRALFAHETVHSWQTPPPAGPMPDLLLYWALMEGVPDYLASLVTGAAPSPEREAWATPRQAQVWRDFSADRALLMGRSGLEFDQRPELNRAIKRWFNNFGDAPPGWPSEAGYWVGQQIAAAYVAQASDPRAAIEALILLKDLPGILKASGFAARFAVP